MSQADPEAGLVRVRRALLSVSDKTGIVAFARTLASFDIELVSTGGTATLLRDEGLDVTEVSDLTGFPEMLGGRVKTLHPNVHGGILGVEHDPTHKTAMDEHGIAPIDLVCVNLYPFEQAPPDASHEEKVELIDIGGPAMLRSAAKNHERVTVVPDPSVYATIEHELRERDGSTTFLMRRDMATLAFRRTSAYDKAIEIGLMHGPRPKMREVSLVRFAELRYGENPHQTGEVYRQPGSEMRLTDAVQLHGKGLSYNNYNDASGALGLVWELHKLERGLASAVVVKHTNPCGAAAAQDARSAIEGTLAGDPMAAYGGILATNAAIDERAAEVLCASDVFLEVIVAPLFRDKALERLRAKSANVRLLELGPFDGRRAHTETMRTLFGGDMLVQSADDAPIDTSSWQHAAGPAPDEAALRAAGVVWAMSKHLSSNAIAIGGPDLARPGVVRLFGAGAGQMDRVASCRIAIEKAGELTQGAIAASDAFFPFSDGPELLVDAGVTTIVHPGGSKRDADTFELCDARVVTCLTTGVRHFRH